MKYLLDTNTCIRYMNGRSQSIVDHLHNHKRGEVVLCSIVKAELRYGAIKSDQSILYRPALHISERT